MSLETILPFIRFCRLLISHPRRLSEGTNLNNLSPCQKPSGTCHTMFKLIQPQRALFLFSCVEIPSAVRQKCPDESCNCQDHFGVVTL